MKVSRDYIGDLIQHRKTQSLYEKTLIGPKYVVFNFFQSSMGGGLTRKPLPPSPVRTLLSLHLGILFVQKQAIATILYNTELT